MRPPNPCRTDYLPLDLKLTATQTALLTDRTGGVDQHNAITTPVVAATMYMPTIDRPGDYPTPARPSTPMSASAVSTIMVHADHACLLRGRRRGA
jgi:hypothetical protein